MRIAPIDIAHKTFSKKFMGLDPDEVIEFLRDVADQMEEIIRERNNLKEAMREKELSIMEYRERDETLKTTITTATRMAEQIRVDAEREAKLIVNDAQQKGEVIIRDSRDSLKRIYQEIAELKRARIQLEANLRSMIQAHISILDQSHGLMPEINIPSQMPQTWAQSPGMQAPLANHSGQQTGHQTGHQTVQQQYAQQQQAHANQQAQAAQQQSYQANSQAQQQYAQANARQTQSSQQQIHAANGAPAQDQRRIPTATRP